jgi:glycosyltransferase involved in cell wall biosynthesis
LESISLSTPFLSIIIPAHNEENRLPHTLDEVFRFLKQQTYTAEVIVVENGSRDRTLEIARTYEATCPQLRILQERRRGKGLAVKKGMLAARGEYRFMCDADFSMPVDEINQFLPPQLYGYPIAIASREAPGAKRYHEPIYRHVVGRIFNTMIRLIALPSLNDTQCGFKCFHAPAAEVLFQRQTLSGFSFDVEVLFIARQLGYQVVEIPIPWYFNPESKVSVLRDSLNMALDLLVIRVNGLRGRYRVGYGSEI